MAVESEGRDYWRWPLFLLWSCYVVLGAFPADLFHILRMAGQVTTQRAFVNSYWLVYLAWILFYAWFVARRALRLGRPLTDAVGMGLLAFLVAAVGFYPLRIVEVLQYARIPDPGLRMLILGCAAAKAMAILFLLGQLARHCLARPAAAAAAAAAADGPA